MFKQDGQKPSDKDKTQESEPITPDFVENMDDVANKQSFENLDKEGKLAAGLLIGSEFLRSLGDKKFKDKPVIRKTFGFILDSLSHGVAKATNKKGKHDISSIYNVVENQAEEVEKFSKTINGKD